MELPIHKQIRNPSKTLVSTEREFVFVKKKLISEQHFMHFGRHFYLFYLSYHLFHKRLHEKVFKQ